MRVHRHSFTGRGEAEQLHVQKDGDNLRITSVNTEDYEQIELVMPARRAVALRSRLSEVLATMALSGIPIDNGIATANSPVRSGYAFRSAVREEAHNSSMTSNGSSINEFLNSVGGSGGVDAINMVPQAPIASPTFISDDEDPE